MTLDERSEALIENPVSLLKTPWMEGGYDQSQHSSWDKIDKYTLTFMQVDLTATLNMLIVT